MTETEGHLRPIFICGCDRSGTTMLGSMLGAVPNAVVTPESQFVTQLMPESTSALSSQEVEELCKSFVQNWRLKIWRIKNLEQQLKQTTGQTATTYRGLIDRIVRIYGSQHGNDAPQVWVDHTPNHIRHAARLLKFFPDATIVHLTRDGRGVAASVIPLGWGPNTVVKAAEWWALKVCSGAAVEQRFGSKRVVRVKYEDILSKPAVTLKSLSNTLRISYDPAMLDGGGFDVPDYTMSDHKLVGKQLNADRINDWQTRLTPREIELFEFYSGDILDYFDYKLAKGTDIRPPTRMELKKIWGKDVLRNLVNSLGPSRLRRLRVKLGR